MRFTVSVVLRRGTSTTSGTPLHHQRNTAVPPAASQLEEVSCGVRYKSETLRQSTACHLVSGRHGSVSRHVCRRKDPHSQAARPARRLLPSRCRINARLTTAGCCRRRLVETPAPLAPSIPSSGTLGRRRRPRPGTPRATSRKKCRLMSSARQELRDSPRSPRRPARRGLAHDGRLTSDELQFFGAGPISETPYTGAEKFESFERINSICETNGNFDSCNSCKRLGTSRLHELFLSCMSQNFRLFHVSNLSIRNGIFLLMYTWSEAVCVPWRGAPSAVAGMTVRTVMLARLVARCNGATARPGDARRERQNAHATVVNY